MVQSTMAIHGTATLISLVLARPLFPSRRMQNNPCSSSCSNNCVEVLLSDHDRAKTCSGARSRQPAIRQIDLAS